MAGIEAGGWGSRGQVKLSKATKVAQQSKLKLTGGLRLGNHDPQGRVLEGEEGEKGAPARQERFILPWDVQDH